MGTRREGRRWDNSRLCLRRRPSIDWACSQRVMAYDGDLQSLQGRCIHPGRSVANTDCARTHDDAASATKPNQVSRSACIQVTCPRPARKLEVFECAG